MELIINSLLRISKLLGRKMFHYGVKYHDGPLSEKKPAAKAAGFSYTSIWETMVIGAEVTGWVNSRDFAHSSWVWMPESLENAMDSSLPY